ncbi:MAG TPA: PAS domain S-box protein [Gemmatimonadales bacterium]|jgi:PAS domain S-box-containing protein
MTLRTQSSAEDTLYAALVEQVPDHAIFLIAPDGHNRTWNLGVQRLLGYSRSEFIGMHAREIFTPEDRNHGVPERELSFVREHGEASDERWLLRRDGTRFWASGITYRLQDAAEELIGFAKIFRDLTVERQFEDELRQSAERYRLATRAGHVALYDRDLNTGTFTWVDGFAEIFGYSTGEVGPSVAWWEERLHPEDRSRVITEQAAVIARGETRWHREYRFRHATGEYALVEDHALIMRSSDGIELRMLGTLSDVTLRRRTEESLRRSQRLEALGRLGGGVAHDLNNMLTTVIGYTEILERSLPQPDERRQYTAQVLGAAHRSAALTRQLLAFARQEITRRSWLDLSAVVSGLTPALFSAAGEGVPIELHLRPDLPKILVDQHQVEQVLLQLVLNARDAMPEGGHITIETTERQLTAPAIQQLHPGIELRPGTYVCLTISDSGMGMSSATLERVFEPFFTTKPVGKGTGLGLASVYGAVKQNDGYIWVYSEPGQGTRFEIYLPTEARSSEQ